MNKLEYPKNYIVWDIETTGFSPTDDRITELGVIMVNEGEIINKRSWLLNYGAVIPEKITEITGITKEMIDKDGVEPAEALSQFLDLFVTQNSVDPHVTHNGLKFDIPFMCEALTRDLKYTSINFEAEINNQMIDTAMLYKAQKLNMKQQWNETFLEFAKRVSNIRAYGVKYNLKLCSEELEIDTSKIDFHRATGDVLVTNEVYKKLCLKRD